MKPSKHDYSDEIAANIENLNSERASLLEAKSEAAKTFDRGKKRIAEMEATPEALREAKDLVHELSHAIYRLQEEVPDIPKPPAFQVGDRVRILSMGTAKSKFAKVGDVRTVLGVTFHWLCESWINRMHYWYILSKTEDGEGEITSRNWGEADLEKA